jgi:hypothetical protein
MNDGMMLPGSPVMQGMSGVVDNQHITQGTSQCSVTCCIGWHPAVPTIEASLHQIKHAAVGQLSINILPLLAVTDHNMLHATKTSQAVLAPPLHVTQQ